METQLTKEEIISILVDDAVDTMARLITEEGDYTYLREIYTHGQEAFCYMSEEELLNEYATRFDKMIMIKKPMVVEAIILHNANNQFAVINVKGLTYGNILLLIATAIKTQYGYDTNRIVLDTWGKLTLEGFARVTFKLDDGHSEEETIKVTVTKIY